MQTTPERLQLDPALGGSITDRYRNNENMKTLQNKFGLYQHWKTPNKTLLPHIRRSIDESNGLSPRYNSHIYNSANKQAGILNSSSIIATGMDEQLQQQPSHQISLFDQQNRAKQAMLLSGTQRLEQPVYTFSQDQEPEDMHKKLQVRLFKRSEKRRDQDKEIAVAKANPKQHSGSNDVRSAGLMSQGSNFTTKYHDPKTNLIKEVVITEENGQLQYKPKNPTNSLRFMHAANYEMNKIESEYRKLAQVEKNRIFLKFVEMNEQPQKYTHYQHYKEGKQRKVQLHLSQHDLENFYLQDLNRKTLTADHSKLLDTDSFQNLDTLNLTQQSLGSNMMRMSLPIYEESYPSPPPNVKEVKNLLSQLSKQIAQLKTQQELVIARDHKKYNEYQMKIDLLIKERDELLNGTYIGMEASREIIGAKEQGIFGQQNSIKRNQMSLSLETMDLFQDNTNINESNRRLQDKKMSQSNVISPQSKTTIKKQKQMFWNLMLQGTVADGANPKEAVPYRRQTPPTMNNEISAQQASMQLTLSSITRPRGLHLQNSVISPRVQQTLDSIKDPMLKIKRSVERFGHDMIEVAKQELNYSKMVDQESEIKKAALFSSTDQILGNKKDLKILQEQQDDSLIEDQNEQGKSLVKPFNPDGSIDPGSSMLLRASAHRRVLSIEQKIEKSTKNINEALKKIDVIEEYKVADWLSVKDFNKKVQALNFNRKKHKYQNMGQPDI